jgi:hypothetical protein
MDGNKLVKLIEALTQATELGKVEWSGIATRGEFKTAVANYTVELSRPGGNSLISSLGYGTRIRVKNEAGAEVISGAEGEFLSAPSGLEALTGVVPVRPVRLGPELGRLYDLVRSSHAQTNKALDEMIRDLKSR